jgi:hypothetical protein
MGDFNHLDSYVWRPGHWHHLGADDPDHHQVLGCRPSQESGASPNSAQAKCCKEIPGTAFLSSYATTTAGWQWPRKEEERGSAGKGKKKKFGAVHFTSTPTGPAPVAHTIIHFSLQGFHQRLEVSDPVSSSFGQGPWTSFNNAMTMADSLQVLKTQRMVQRLEQSLLDWIVLTPMPELTSSAEETLSHHPATPLEYMDLAPTPECQVMPPPTPPHRHSPVPPVIGNCHHRCSEPLDCGNRYTELSVIEIRINRALPPRSVAKPGGRRLPLWQEVEDKEVNWVEDKRLYLPFTGQVGDPLYSNTREAVHTLKCPIRGK